MWVTKIFTLSDNSNEQEMIELKNFKWSKQATMLLVNSYKERKEDFRNPKIKKRGLWTIITNIFLKHGYNVTEDDLDRKWRNMKKTYTNLVDNKSATGRGRIFWEFYEDFQEIYMDDKAVNIPQTVSSLQPTSQFPVTPGQLDAFKCNSDNPSTPSNSQNVVKTPSSSRLMKLSACQSPGFANVTNLLQSPLVSQETVNKRTRNKNLYVLRKRMADLEERRVEELKLLRLAVEQNNKIQQERNELLKKMLDK